MRMGLELVCLLLLATASSSWAVNCPWPCRCAWVVDSLYADCSRRSLHTFPNFDGIPVEHLDLSGNQFGQFPTQYADIDSLIYLDLSNNQISALDGKSLIGFTSLRTLLLANNSIGSWEALSPNEAFKYAPSLKRLGLDGNHLGSFGSGESFELLTSQSLTELELSSCDISALGGDQLMNQLPNLERLNLANNQLTQMAALPSRSLRSLDLSNCSIQHLSGFFLDSLQHLEALNLSRNTQLEFGGLEEDPVLTFELRKLDVSYCNLDSIDLSGLPQLTELRLRGNLLRSIDATTFANNTMLEVLDLSQNVLRLLGQDAFANLKRLKQLNLAFNEIARLDRNFIRNNDVLVELNLSRNVLQKLTRIVSNSVRTINMSWCEITFIDSSALSSLSVIQKLDLSNNLISDFPTFMRSETLQELNLANCRLSTVRNNTFREFPELADLHLNGNRLTSPIPPYYFGSNKFLDQLWLGDNPWICDCHNPLFVEFYDFLTAKPAKIKDKNHLRCAAPAIFYNKLWEFACADVWIQNARSSSGGEKAWSIIMITLLLLGGLILAYACLQKFLKKRKVRDNHREYAENDDELRRIRDLNDRILLEDATPSIHQQQQEISLLPSYEDALRMPKLVRPVKSMMDLSGPERARNSRKLRRSQTHAEGEGSQSEAEDSSLQLDSRQRFRSVEMLSNRDKERTAQYGPYRRTGHMEYSQSGSRRFSIEDSRFPAAHLKTQNLQSAEQIGNFQSYENSPYTKRKPKIAEIPPFKRVNMAAASVEFLTDPEYDDVEASKPGSPFAKRKPKKSLPPPPSMKVSAQVYTLKQSPVLELDPAVEDYFSAAKKQASSSTIGSDFQELHAPELRSLPDENRSSASPSESEHDLERAKRRKRKNSSSRRVSGSFTAANAGDGSSSSSDTEQHARVHRPMRETLF
ncbi:insulin-like growth factor-binding protein complex acid labile subunit [Drosophila kikkawai]|uniref:Insulin-like growth factor-binding protein complex acid labile subunit n=1 Tax=Drosophila kikkawai TaxID=30033 RepID=A0A6P4IR25_DROKI|nr:LRR receptor-like serine/threonine-protein kinase ERL1 [Drosophila kikkawai]XP_017025297.1 LRR receptor-like serine/threonine-protein kinase ERL1 [Drosophila kikkawai]